MNLYVVYKWFYFHSSVAIPRGILSNKHIEERGNGMRGVIVAWWGSRWHSEAGRSRHEGQHNDENVDANPGALSIHQSRGQKDKKIMRTE